MILTTNVNRDSGKKNNRHTAGCQLVLVPRKPIESVNLFLNLDKTLE